MNTIKSFGLAALAAAVLLAFPAFATPTTCPVGFQGSPVCINTNGGDGSNSSLQDILGSAGTPNSIFSSGPGVNVYTDQVEMPFWAVNGSSGSVATILLQLSSNANHDNFGIFDPTNTNNKLALFTGGQTGGQAMLSVYVNGGYAVNLGPKTYFGTTNHFGYYLMLPDGTTFYSLPSLNVDGGFTHMVAYAGDGKSFIAPANGFPGGTFGGGEYIQAWEDGYGGGDVDYQDFIVMVESVHPVPEPAALGVFGLGLLLLGGFVALRRRGEGTV